MSQIKLYNRFQIKFKPFVETECYPELRAPPPVQISGLFLFFGFVLSKRSIFFLLFNLPLYTKMVRAQSSPLHSSKK